MMIMTPPRVAIVSVLMLLSVAAAAPVHAAIKCWTNKEGVRECGNTVPPEYAQQAHETKSSTGITVEKQAAAKTAEQVQAERQERQTAAEAAAREAAAAAKQTAADRVLLDTFSSEDDLILARDGKIAHIESQIKLTQSHIDKLERNLDEAIQSAADVERRGQQPSDQMAQNIESLRKQVRENREFIEGKRREQTNIHEEFDANVARFRQLQGGN